MVWFALMGSCATCSGSDAKTCVRGIPKLLMACATASIPEQSVPRVRGRLVAGLLLRVLLANMRCAGGAALRLSQDRRLFLCGCATARGFAFGVWAVAFAGITTVISGTACGSWCAGGSTWVAHGSNCVLRMTRLVAPPLMGATLQLQLASIV